MTELQKLKIYDKIIDYGEFISFTMVLLLPIVFIFITTFNIFLTWFAFVGMFIFIEHKGVEIGTKLVHLDSEEFFNSPEGKNYFHKLH